MQKNYLFKNFNHTSFGKNFHYSGGGFYVNIDSTWYLQGIVSSSLLDQNLACDVKNFAVYTNVAHYTNWIWEKVEGIESLALLCEFDIATNLRR